MSVDTLRPANPEVLPAVTPAPEPVQAGGRPAADPVDAMLVPDPVAARLVGLSTRAWQRLTAAGKNPRPIKLGRRTLHSRETIQQWVRLGCPDRRTFELLTAAKGGRQ